MVAFLTSSPTKQLDEACPVPSLDERNDFLLRLREDWKAGSRCLMIAAFPDAHDRNDEMTAFYQEAVRRSGLPVSGFDLWDGRHPALSKEQLWGYDVVFLAGGHVPRERKWFQSIRLKEQLEGFDGIVVGTSAGSMNMAKTVYAWPELEGESLDPGYELFFQGLGLAETMILPHYQKLKDNWLDGRRLLEDITCSHSHGRRFLAIPDGSYVLVKNAVETVFGEAYLVSEGKISPFCEKGRHRVLWPAEERS